MGLHNSLFILINYLETKQVIPKLNDTRDFNMSLYDLVKRDIDRLKAFNCHIEDTSSGKFNINDFTQYIQKLKTIIGNNYDDSKR